MHTNYQFQKAFAHQKEAIFELILENARWLKSKETLQWPEDWIFSQKDRIFQSVSEGLFYTYSVDSKLVGVVELREEPEELWEFDTTASTYIYKLAVSREYAGQKIGKRIIDDVISRAKHLKLLNIRLDCAAYNQRLCSYYESVGFKFICHKNLNNFHSALFEMKV